MKKRWHLLAGFWRETSPKGAAQESPGGKPWEQARQHRKPRRGDALGAGIIEVPYGEHLSGVESEPPYAALSGLSTIWTLNPGLALSCWTPSGSLVSREKLARSIIRQSSIVMISFLFIDTERVWRGGQHQLLTLLKGLLERGHEMHLACLPGTLLEQQARAIRVNVHPLYFRNEFIGFWRLLALMRQIRPNIVAFNTPRPILVGSLASRLVRVQARFIFRRVNFPLGRNPMTRLKYNWGIDCIVAISDSIRRQLEKGGVPPWRIRMVYEGLDLRDYPR